MTLKGIVSKHIPDPIGLTLSLAIGTAGGAVFDALELPLAWMLGAMVGNTVASLLGVRVSVPGHLRGLMVIVLGLMLGAAFTPDLISHLDEWGVSLSILVAYTVVTTVAGALYLNRVIGYDAPTAFFTAAPGGLSEMVVVGGRMGGDDRIISLTHGLRILLVVMTVPIIIKFTSPYDQVPGALGPGIDSLSVLDGIILAVCGIAGYWLARKFNLPAAVLIGPLVLSAFVHLVDITQSRPPGVLVAVAQVVVGSAIGTRFAGVPLQFMARTTAVAVGLTVIMLSVTALLAGVIHWTTGLDYITGVLALSPGGVAEMSLIALALGVDIAMISAHHIARIFIIVAIAPSVFKYGRRFLR